MLPFLMIAFLVLALVLLSDLVGGFRRSEDSQKERWERAMSALSSTPVPSPRAADDDRVEPERYDLAA